MMLVFKAEAEAMLRRAFYTVCIYSPDTIQTSFTMMRLDASILGNRVELLSSCDP